MKTLAAEKAKGQSMSLLCRLFGKSWQAYYQHRDTLGKQRLREEMVIQFVKDIRRLDPGIGGKSCTTCIVSASAQTTSIW